jgi:hypothetical protein
MRVRDQGSTIGRDIGARRVLDSRIARNGVTSFSGDADRAHKQDPAQPRQHLEAGFRDEKAANLAVCGFLHQVGPRMGHSLNGNNPLQTKDQVRSVSDDTRGIIIADGGRLTAG